MKYIKKFENYYTKEYWKIRSDSPYFQASLFKIGVPENELETFIEYQDIGYSVLENEYIYLIFDKINSEFYLSNSVNLAKFLENGTVNFSGEIEVTPEDINRYELSRVANKYNL